MCIEVECGGRVASNCGELLDMLGINALVMNDKRIDHTRSCCLCIVDIEKTALSAGYRVIGHNETGWDALQVSIKKKGADDA